jgi:membrane protease YdiL (CAAX protease family)
MGDFRNHLFPDEKTPLYQLFLFIFVVFVGGALLFSLTVVAGRYIFDTDPNFLDNMEAVTGSKEAGFMKYTLIMQQITLFILPALLLMSLINSPQKSRFPDFKPPALHGIILVVLLAFCLFPITGFTGQLNSQMNFPEWLSGVEKWMVEKEDSAGRIIQMLTTPETIWTMFGNIIIIAVLPALGEELIFRGVLQKILARLLRSGNASVWITAFVFSSLHLQFFGFLPRFILGLVFGYLFLWSGTLWLPVIAHFVNNAVSVAAEYFQWGNSANAMPDSKIWQLMGGIVFPGFAILLILLYFKSRQATVPVPERKNKETNG